jgi:DNA-binding transcriptional LysR family regulator
MSISDADVLAPLSGRLRDVEIRHLAALVAVADTGSFGRAATLLGFTQSAVSQQIAALERVAGEPMFDRPGGPRPVEITPAGEVLLEHARVILGHLREAEQDLDALRAGEQGRLAIGTFQSVSVKILPAVITALKAERPGIDVHLIELADQAVLFDQVHSGALDLTFVNRVEDPRLTTEFFFEDPMMYVTAARPGSPTGPVRPADINRVSLIGEQASSCQAIIEASLQRAGVTPNYVFRSNDNGAMQAMVRAGMGDAVMALLAIDTADPGIVIRPIDPPLEPRLIGVAWRSSRTLPPAARRFVELARDVCRELAPERSAA